MFNADGALLLDLISLAALITSGSLVSDYLPALTSPGISISFWPILVVLLLAVLAEIWRHGAALQEDAEATV